MPSFLSSAKPGFPNCVWKYDFSASSIDSSGRYTIGGDAPFVKCRFRLNSPHEYDSSLFFFSINPNVNQL